MEQAVPAVSKHDSKKQCTGREVIFKKMEGLIAWERLEGRSEQLHPKAGRGRRRCPLRSLPPVQLFCGLSHPEMKHPFRELESLRRLRRGALA